MNTAAPLTPLQAAQAEAREATARAAQLTAELEADTQRRAKSAVEAAVQRGAIPVRAVALRAKWLQACLEYPAALELLSAANGSTALDNRRASPPPLAQTERAGAEAVAVDAAPPAYSFAQSFTQ